MSNLFDWIESLESLGVAGLALLFLWLTNKYHLREKERQEDRHREEIIGIREEHQDRVDELNAAIDAKNEVIVDLSGQLREASQGALANMERHLTRQNEREVGRERDNASTNAAISQLATAVKGLTAEVRAGR